MIRPLVVGHDAAWGGWAWAIVHGDELLATRWVNLSGRAWRWRDVSEELAGLDAEIARIRQVRDVGPTRVVVEKAPDVYRGRGNQAAVGYGLGTLAGAILLSATRPEDLYPWTVEVAEWRSWWGLRGRREVVKAGAITLATRLGYGPTLRRYEKGRDDVAEAILIARGAADRPLLAPKGPKGWGP